MNRRNFLASLGIIGGSLALSSIGLLGDLEKVRMVSVMTLFPEETTEIQYSDSINIREFQSEGKLRKIPYAYEFVTEIKFTFWPNDILHCEDGRFFRVVRIKEHIAELMLL